MTDVVNSDGRKARKIKNREAIVQSALSHVLHGTWRPSVPQIAAGAGVSIRTVFSLFGTIEGVYEELMRQHGTSLRAEVLRVARNDPSNWNHVLGIIFIGRGPSSPQEPV